MVDKMKNQWFKIVFHMPFIRVIRRNMYTNKMYCLFFWEWQIKKSLGDMDKMHSTQKGKTLPSSCFDTT